MPTRRRVRAKKSSAARPKAKPSAAVRTRKPAASDRSSWVAGAVALTVLALLAIAMVFGVRDSSPVAAATTVEAQEADVPSSEPIAKPKVTKASAAAAAADGHGSAMETPDSEPEGTTGAISGAVSIAGCLRRADGGFVLKDADGAAVPKSRSWKSGFLKKSSPPLAMSGAANGVRLSNHVDERVSVTGTIIDREMSVQSVRRLSATCG
jgi:hypothetical protein